MARLSFALSVLRRRLSAPLRTCPHCHSANTRLIARKKLLLELRRCEECWLQWRYPKDETATSRDYYQRTYSVNAVTELPQPETLARLRASGFRGAGELDFGTRIGYLRAHVAAGKVLDFGCSWGYSLVQMAAAGYRAIGFEVSRPRARFGREALGVDIFDDIELLLAAHEGSFDAVISSHVLEHIPNIAAALAAVRRLLKPTGTFLALVPNAGGRLARERGVRWGPLISEDHCLALDARFFARNLPTYGLAPRFAASPYPHPPIALDDGDAAAEAALDGDELMVVARAVSAPVALERAS